MKHFIDYINIAEGGVRPTLRQKLEIVEKCIASSLKKKDFKAAVDFHKKDILLLEEVKMTPHKLEISLRNSFQFALWKYLSQQS